MGGIGAGGGIDCRQTSQNSRHRGVEPMGAAIGENLGPWQAHKGKVPK